MHKIKARFIHVRLGIGNLFIKIESQVAQIITCGKFYNSSQSVAFLLSQVMPETLSAGKQQHKLQVFSFPPTCKHTKVLRLFIKNK